MSAQEASWHEHLAGMRAADAARAQGADPTATAALASSTAGETVIANRKLAPASQGTVWTLQRMAREFAAEADASRIPSGENGAPGTRELLELGLATLVFCDARRCWKMLDGGRLADLIGEAETMMWEMPLTEQLALQKHFRAEMDRVRALAGGEDDTPPGKLPETAGASPATAIPPQEPALPPSNGSAPNIISHLKQPSGTSRFP